MMIGRHWLRCWPALGLLLASSPAFAKTCGQQTVLSAAQRLSPQVKVSVRRDQLKLQSFENEAARSLLRFGFPSSDLRRLLVDYEASVPVYCLVTPDSGAPGKNALSSQLPEKRKVQLRAIMTEWRRSFGIKPEDAQAAGCSDCKIAERWRHILLVSEDLFNKSGQFSQFEAAYDRNHFAKIHRSMSNGAISIFISRIGQYAM